MPTAANPEPPRLRVLAIFCNPRGTDHLRLQAEQRVLQQSLRFASASLDPVPAATIDDLRVALLGLLTSEPGIFRHDKFRGLAVEDAISAATRRSEELRRDHAVDAVIAHLATSQPSSPASSWAPRLGAGLVLAKDLAAFFASASFPGEEETLFPPLTYLKPTSKREQVDCGARTFTVVEVVPHFGSA